MATKGYHSYHGKNRGGRTILVVVLILILLAAIGYLLFQELVVYDEQGQIHLELPWQREAEDADASPTAFPTVQFPSAQTAVLAAQSPSTQSPSPSGTA